MLENPSIPSYSSTHLVDSDNARVRKTSRKPETPVSADPQRPYAGPLNERKRWFEPCGDVGRLTEMISPSIVKIRSNVTWPQRNSLSGRHNCPVRRRLCTSIPLITAKPPVLCTG